MVAGGRGKDDIKQNILAPYISSIKFGAYRWMAVLSWPSCLCAYCILSCISRHDYNLWEVFWDPCMVHPEPCKSSWTPHNANRIFWHIHKGEYCMYLVWNTSSVPQNFSHHMIWQARAGVTVLVKSKEMTGRTQTLPWWLGEEVKMTEN